MKKQNVLQTETMVSSCMKETYVAFMHERNLCGT